MLDDLRYIAAHMRDSDREEVAATMPHGDLKPWPDLIHSFDLELSKVWRISDIPVAFAGFLQTGCYALNSFMVATPAAAALGWKLHRDCLLMHRELVDRGFRRFWCIPLLSSQDNIAWLQRLGYQMETVTPLASWSYDPGVQLVTMAWVDGMPELWRARRCADLQLQS